MNDAHAHKMLVQLDAAELELKKGQFTGKGALFEREFTRRIGTIDAQRRRAREMLMSKGAPFSGINRVTLPPASSVHDKDDSMLLRARSNPWQGRIGGGM